MPRGLDDIARATRNDWKRITPMIEGQILYLKKFESEYYSLVVLILFIIFIISSVFFYACIILYPLPFTKSTSYFFYLLIRAFLESRGLFPIGLVAVALLFDRFIQHRKLKIAVMVITLSFGVFFLAGVLAVLFWLFI